MLNGSCSLSFACACSSKYDTMRMGDADKAKFGSLWVVIKNYLFRPDLQLRRIPEDASYKIPKVCYQTWVTKNIEELAPYTREVVLRNRAINPDIRFELFDDTDVDTFIKKEFSGDIYDAFNTINPRFGAARADFFRYCILFKQGGLYLDIKSEFKSPKVFGTLILPEDDAVMDVRRGDLEVYRKQWGYGVHEQWFLAFKPQHPYLERIIMRMTRSILNRIVPPAPDPKKMILRITGPDALAAAVHDAVVDCGLMHREVNFNKYLRYSGKSYLRMYGDSNQTHYSQLTEVHIYKDMKKTSLKIGGRRETGNKPQPH